MRFDDREVHSLVQSYERATENNRQPYYDVEDLETIVNITTIRDRLIKCRSSLNLQSFFTRILYF